MPWDVEKVKNSQPELGWFPHIRKTTGIRQPHDSVHRVCVCVCVGGGGRGELLSHVQPTLCNPMDCSPPGSSVHGILQANRLPFPSPGHLPDSSIEPKSPALQADSLPSEPPV